MSTQLFKNQLYASIHEILKDESCYHKSVVGHQYNKLTEKGERAVVELITMYSMYIMEKEQKFLEELLKNMVWDELKK